MLNLNYTNLLNAIKKLDGEFSNNVEEMVDASTNVSVLTALKVAVTENKNYYGSEYSYNYSIKRLADGFVVNVGKDGEPMHYRLWLCPLTKYDLQDLRVKEKAIKNINDDLCGGHNLCCFTYNNFNEDIEIEYAFVLCKTKKEYYVVRRKIISNSYIDQDSGEECKSIIEESLKAIKIDDINSFVAKSSENLAGV